MIYNMSTVELLDLSLDQLNKLHQILDENESIIETYKNQYQLDPFDEGEQHECS